MSEEITLEDYKRAWREMVLRETRGGLVAHLASYIIVNCFLIFINLWTSPGALWFPWPLAGWGIGLAFHAVFSRPHHVIEELRKKEALAELIAREMKSKSKQA
ncbi:MAG: 2TM domain-containing protein [Nitrososphaeria archaeon]|nr:2TM domain-containing protein [Aigarchaeota archaeon]MCX8187761.1 2TM domain-containing protein [Nitrososphaeria archaeon]